MLPTFVTFLAKHLERFGQSDRRPRRIPVHTQPAYGLAVLHACKTAEISCVLDEVCAPARLIDGLLDALDVTSLQIFEQPCHILR